MSFLAVCFLQRPLFFNLIFCSALLLFQLPVLADQSVTLSWDSTGDSNVAGYRIYYGVASRDYTNFIDVGNVTSATVSGLVPDTTYYFAATTYDVFGNESDYSNETTYHTPPATGIVGAEATLTPAILAGGKFNLMVSGTSGALYVVQASTNLVDWVSVQTNAASFTFVDDSTAGFKQRFFRTYSLSP